MNSQELKENGKFLLEPQGAFYLPLGQQNKNQIHKGEDNDTADGTCEVWPEVWVWEVDHGYAGHRGCSNSSVSNCNSTTRETEV